MPSRALRLAPLVVLASALCACRDERAPSPAPEDSRPAGAAIPPAPGAGLGGPGVAPATTRTAPAAGNGGVMPKVGDRAPEFKARDHTGQMRSLADYRGKRVVLWFYPKASTGG